MPLSRIHIVLFATLLLLARAEAHAATGAELYADACASCHGTNGRGRSDLEVGFDIPLPDFTDCSFASREPDEDWFAIVHEGGPVRGFDPMMPAFGEALSEEQLQRILDHVRTYCGNDDWPRGELNLPRALRTEKAYPEDEAVVTASLATEGETQFTQELIWEKRFGSRSQVEIIIPFSILETTESGRVAGINDIALGIKHAVYHNLGSGSILSIGGEIALPTGDEQRGLGTGSSVAEPFILYGQVLPAAMFLQMQLLAELPLERELEDEMAWRLAVGRTFTSGRYGRAWTPMLEVLAARELESGASTEWDVVPQLQITLNTRQHVSASLGLRLPVTDADTRDTEVAFYILWDWYDGSLLDGW